MVIIIRYNYENKISFGGRVLNKLINKLVLVAILITLYLIGISTTYAHEDAKDHKASANKESTTKDMMGMDEETMKKWMEYATPNENHKVLDGLVGKWDYKLKWWQAPGAKPEKSTGRSKIKWTMDGRFLRHKAKGTSMGQPFRGMGIVGFNNETKKYESVWIDNMGTGMARGTGTYDAKTKKLTEEGTFSCPGEGNKKFRSVMTITGPDTFTYEWYMPGPDKKEYRAMVIDYTRKKEEKK